MLWAILAAVLSAPVPAAAVPTNGDFEFSTLSGWAITSLNSGGTSGRYVQVRSRYTGSACTSGATNWAPICSGVLERVPPGNSGCWAAEICSGDGCTNGQASQWTQLATTFGVPASATFQFTWAALLPDGHACSSGTSILIETLANGNPISGAPCSLITAEAMCASGGLGSPTPTSCTMPTCGGPGPNTTWQRYPWQTCTISLAAYAGQTITFRGRATSCSATVHNGYLYLDDVLLTVPTSTPTVSPTATETPAPPTLTYLATISFSLTVTQTPTETATPTSSETVSRTASPTATPVPANAGWISWPNPARRGESISFLVPAFDAALSELSVYRLTGEEVFFHRFSPGQSVRYKSAKGTTSLGVLLVSPPLSLASGVYLAELRSATARRVVRLAIIP